MNGTCLQQQQQCLLNILQHRGRTINLTSVKRIQSWKGHKHMQYVENERAKNNSNRAPNLILRLKPTLIIIGVFL
jgi:hypothetical protein